MFAWRLFTSFKLVFYLKVWIIVPIYYAETLQLLDAGSRSSFILTNFATLKYITNNKHWYSYAYSYSGEEFFWCRYLASRYVDTFIVYSNSKRRPQWNIQTCQQRDMENGYLETDTIEHFDVRQLSAKWSLIMHFTEYRCWSPHYLLLTCRRLIFRPSISQDKSNQNIFIFWFPIRVQIANSWLAAPDSDGRGPGTANDAWKVPAEAGIGSLTISSAFWVSVHLSARIFALVFLRHYSGSSQCPGPGCLFRLRLDISRQCVLHVPGVTADN